MHSTGILLIVCGVPATVLLSLLFMRDRSPHLSSSEAAIFCLSMIVLEVLAACVLLLAARRISNLRGRIQTTQDENHRA
jgi:hypothetical protein